MCGDRDGSMLSGCCTGVLKTVTLILGVASVGLTSGNYYNPIVGNANVKETFYLASVIILFIASFIWISLFLIDLVKESELINKFDLLFHLLGGLFLLASATLWFVSTEGPSFPSNDLNYDKGSKFNGSIGKREKYDTQHYNVRMYAGVCGVANGLVYLLISIIIAL